MARGCYQCDENMDEIAERRNAEIRAWGREQLRVADESLSTLVRDGGDWDLVETFEETPPTIHIEDAPLPVIEPEPEPVKAEPVPKTPKPKPAAT